VTLVLRYAARSDVGLVRSNNEDSVYAGARLLALADGMGGHAAGEVASDLAIQAIRKEWCGQGLHDAVERWLERWQSWGIGMFVAVRKEDERALGRIGFLHDAMFRAVRLVVDTGMHAMKWSREDAIKFYVATLGNQESEAITEIERYCVQPGQACGYMLGKLTFLAARKKAKDALGDRFDIKSFHDAMLIGGAVPLAMIDQMTDRYIASRKA